MQIRDRNRSTYKASTCPRCQGTGQITGTITSVTEKQMKTFKAFKKFFTENGYPPSVRTLAAREMEGATSVYNKLMALVDKGILGKEKDRAWNNWYIIKDIERR
jgi:hypothetical protein